MRPDKKVMNTWQKIILVQFSFFTVLADSDDQFFDAIRRSDEEEVLRLSDMVNVDCIELASGKTPLIAAIEKGYVKVAEILLDNGADPDAPGLTSGTPLMLTIINDQEVLFNLLIEKGADVHQFYFEKNPLMVACDQSRLSMVKTLLCKNVDINIPSVSTQITALGFACKKSNIAIITTLLNHGATINPCDCTGRTPLSYAAELGLQEIVEILVYHGADPRLTDHAGFTPLSYAVRNFPEIVLFLLEHGATFNTSITYSENFIHKTKNIIKSLLIKPHARIKSSSTVDLLRREETNPHNLTRKAIGYKIILAQLRQSGHLFQDV